MQEMLTKIDELQNRIKDDLESEKNRNLEMTKSRTDSMKRLGKDLSKAIKTIISDIGFNEANRDEGQGSSDMTFSSVFPGIGGTTLDCKHWFWVETH